MSTKVELEKQLRSANRKLNRLSKTVNRFEAAQPSSPKRSHIPAFVQSARQDANSWSRWEMTRRIRYFERNVWLVDALADEEAKWTTGSNGIGINPASTDDKWNKGMKEAYDEWCERPFIDSTITMAQGHKQIARTVHLEREIFINKTRTKLDGEAAKPAVQLIESHRCSAPGTVYTVREVPDQVDGVQLGKESDGRMVSPVGYWFIDDPLMSQWTFRSVKDVHHVFDPERSGMYRGVSPYHSVMNTLHDLDDLELLAMEKAKNIAEVANIIYTPGGELNRDARMQRRFGMGAGGDVNNNSSREEDLDKRMAVYRKVMGAKTFALRTGEKWEQVASETPTVAEQWFWIYKIGQICYVAGVPLILIFPDIVKSWNGTVVRSILDNAHEHFKERFTLNARAAVDMYLYFANWARFNDARCLNAPADWNKVHVTPPRACNVDIGYTSAATIAEYGVGIDNLFDIAGRKGQDAEQMVRKKARSIRLIKKIAKEESGDGIEVSPEEISSSIADALQKMAQTEQLEQSEEISGGDEAESGGQEKPGSKKRTKAAKNK